MSLQNLMEGIVGSTVDSILKNDKDIAPLKLNRDDIAALVLNQTQPFYVTSERGLLHGSIATRSKTQQKMDIIVACYEAINLIKSRRFSEDERRATAPVGLYIIRRIMGEAADAETAEPVSDVKISLLYDGELSSMLDASWDNPYTTREATKGYYHFWPVFVEDKMKGLRNVPFTLRFEHPDFKTEDVDIQIDVDITPSSYLTEFIPTVLLKRK